jgi:large subunit ribosomal protein L24
MPIPSANVAVVCGACDKATRIGYRFSPEGEKVRICRKCGADV